MGRGLRLPVDENGHRVHQEEWPSRLSFLIGYDEKAFASMLVDEINRDSKVQLNEQKLDEAMITLIVTERQKSILRLRSFVCWKIWMIKTDQPE